MQITHRGPGQISMSTTKRQRRAWICRSGYGIQALGCRPYDVGRSPHRCSCRHGGLVYVPGMGACSPVYSSLYNVHLLAAVSLEACVQGDIPCPGRGLTTGAGSYRSTPTQQQEPPPTKRLLADSYIARLEGLLTSIRPSAMPLLIQQFPWGCG